MATAKTRNANGYTYNIEHTATTKEEAEKIEKEIKKKYPFIARTKLFKIKKGYEIGWSYN